jgi:U4/U6 small nuclear ribonucleoprotein PRP31
MVNPSFTHVGSCAVYGPIEEDPEYKLIVEANNITVEIDNEISESIPSLGPPVTFFSIVRSSLAEFPLKFFVDAAVCCFSFSSLMAGVIHKFVRDLYARRFPELDQLVLHPLDYIKTVKVNNSHRLC